MSINSKDPSQNKNYEEKVDSKSKLVNQGPWTFGYPQCINKH